MNRSLAATALSVVALVPVSAAHAEPAASGVVEVAVAPGGFAAPATVPSGRLRLAVSTSDPSGAWLGLVRLHDGVPVSRYLADLRLAMGSDPASSLEGARRVAGEAVLLGGAAVTPGTPATVTVDVTPGPLLLVDYRDHAEPDLESRVRVVTVAAGGREAGLPGTPRDIRLVRAGDGVRFEAPDRLGAGQPCTVTNETAQPNEAMLLPVRADVTEADLRAFFAALDRGDRDVRSPFTGLPVGAVPLSPGRSAVLATDLPAGRYGLVTWVRDLESGRHHAATGAARVVEVTADRRL